MYRNYNYLKKKKLWLRFLTWNQNDRRTIAFKQLRNGDSKRVEFETNIVGKHRQTDSSDGC